MADVRVINDGTMVGLHVMSDEAENWVSKNVASEPWQWLGRILWLDARMAAPVINGMQEEGLDLDV